MNYTDLLYSLRRASSFDLYRLQVAIRKELENPQRVNAIKQKLRLGMELSYFDYVENRSIKAKLIELKPKNALVLDLERQREFILPYYMLNTEGVSTTIHEKTNTLTANNLKVGDQVGFNSRDGRDIVGIVKRLSRNTVTLHTAAGQKWRVGYSYLYRIHDAETVMKNTGMYLLEDHNK